MESRLEVSEYPASIKFTVVRPASGFFAGGMSLLAFAAIVAAAKTWHAGPGIAAFYGIVGAVFLCTAIRFTKPDVNALTVNNLELKTTYCKATFRCIARMDVHELSFSAAADSGPGGLYAKGSGYYFCILPDINEE